MIAGILYPVKAMHQEFLLSDSFRTETGHRSAKTNLIARAYQAFSSTERVDLHAEQKGKLF